MRHEVRIRHFFPFARLPKGGMEEAVRRFLLAVAFLLVATIPCTAGSDSQTEQNKRIVTRMVEIINSRDYDRLGEVMSSDLVRHSAATPDVNVKSLEDMRKFLEMDNQAVPDSVVTIEDLIAEGNMVAGRLTYEGTQEGAMGPFPPSNKRVKGPFLAFLRIQDGKVAEMWVEWDNLSMLVQLGHYRPNDEAAAAAKESQK